MNFFVRKILGKYFTSDQWANFIVKETADLAGKVFNLREYQEGIIEMKNVFKKDLANESDGDIKEFFYCLEAVAIGGALHITRGKVMPDKFLKNHMMTWLGVLHMDLAKKIN